MRLFRLATAFFLAAGIGAAHAGGINDLTGSEATSGLKEALVKGADYAVSSLGKENGFLGNKKVKIPLPDSLRPWKRA